MSDGDNKLPAIELNGDGKHGSHSGTMCFYKVQVRTSAHHPTTLEGLTIDNAWRDLPIMRGAAKWGVNIPVSRAFSGSDALDHGMVPYVAAEAHRWAFLAYLEAMEGTGTLCIETRLVQIECKFSFETKEIGVTDAMKEWGQWRKTDGFKPRTLQTT